jgi:hypothetical protein
MYRLCGVILDHCKVTDTYLIIIYLQLFFLSGGLFCFLYTTRTGKVGIGATPTTNSTKFEVRMAAANSSVYNAVTSRTIDCLFLK